MPRHHRPTDSKIAHKPKVRQWTGTHPWCRGAWAFACVAGMPVYNARLMIPLQQHCLWLLIALAAVVAGGPMSPAVPPDIFEQADNSSEEGERSNTGGDSEEPTSDRDSPVWKVPARTVVWYRKIKPDREVPTRLVVCQGIRPSVQFGNGSTPRRQSAASDVVCDPCPMAPCECWPHAPPATC